MNRLYCKILLKESTPVRHYSDHNRTWHAKPSKYNSSKSYHKQPDSEEVRGADGENE